MRVPQRRNFLGRASPANAGVWEAAGKVLNARQCWRLPAVWVLERKQRVDETLDRLRHTVVH